MKNTEIEVRFLEIDKEELIKKLLSLGAKDLGEKMLEEVIIYDKDLAWIDTGKLIRIRKLGDKTKLTYKNHRTQKIGGVDEIEIEINDSEKTLLLLENLGFKAYRRQQKKRHTLEYKNVLFDIDTWPRIPAYVELEGPSEEAIKIAAADVGFDWKVAVEKDARWVIENVYKIPLGRMHWFTFDRFE